MSITSLTKLSRQAFRIGVISTATLMPLDLLTQGGLVIELVVLCLLLQRVLVEFISSPKLKTLKSLLLSSLPFALPVIAFGLASIFAIDTKLAAVYSLAISLLLLRGWIFARFLEKEDLELFENSTLIMSGILVAFGLWQFFADTLGLLQKYTFLQSAYRARTVFPFPRVHAFTQEPLFFANYLLLPISILIVRIKNASSRSNAAKWYGLFYILALALFLTTVSRTAALGLAVAGFVYLLSLRRNLKPIWRLAKLSIISALLAVAMIYSINILPYVNQDAGRVLKPDGSISAFGARATDLSDPSAKTRLEIWPKGLNAFKQYPLTGIGPNNIRPYLHPERWQQGHDISLLQPLNNDFLTLSAEVGIIGILSFWPLLRGSFTAIRTTYRHRFSTLSAPYSLATIAIAVQAIGFGAFGLMRTWIVIGVLLASHRIQAASKR